MPQELQKPWEIQYTRPPTVSGGKPWEKAWTKDIAAKPTPQQVQPAAVASTKPFAEEHPFQAGVTKSFGFDPERISKAGDTEAQWKELGSQLVHTHLPSLKKTALSILKDPLNIAVPIEQMAKGVEASGSKLYQGLKTGNHNQAWEAGGELFGALGQLLAGAETKAKLGEYASTSHGAVKAAAETATKLGVDVEKATTTAHRASNGWLGRMIHNRAVHDQYIDAKGLQIAQDVDKAVKSIEEEYGSHAENLEKQIDKALPTGVIDAAAEADKIKTALADTLKTPQNLHPSIGQLLSDAKRTAPGQWTFAKARQFRSSLGRALGHIEGPQLKVGWQIYDDLSKKLSGVAKKYGLSKEWEHYNTLTSQYHKYYSKIADDIVDAKAGEQVAQALNKYKGLTDRFVKNLSKYGLRPEDITKHAKLAEKWRRENMSVGRGSLFRMAYGSKGGIPVMIAGRAAGMGWLPSVGAGALAGYLSTEITNMLRAAKLSPEVLEHILNTTSIPGKMPKGKGTFPTEEEPGEPPQPTPWPAPVPTPGVPSAPTPTAKPKAFPAPGQLKGGINVRGVEASTAKRSSAEDIQSHTAEIDRLKKIEENPKATTEEKASAKNQRETHEELRAQKVPEGQHGKGQLAEQAKARERITKNREKAKRGAEAEATEAKARAEAQGIDVSKLQIPEMEEALRGLEPVAWSALQKGRKAKLFAEQDYEPYLREMLLRAYEAKTSK